jgi:pectin methylesterase-like acyl-CoA thioesterase
MKTVCTAWVLIVALSIANPLFAAGGKKKDAKDAGVPYFKQIDRTLKPVTLSDEQKSKLDALKKEYEPKLKEAYATEKANALSPEQKTAGEEAKKAAVAAGKKGKDVQAAVDAAVKKTDAQKHASKPRLALEKEMRAKILALLTDEQKAEIKAASGKKPAKPAKADATNSAPATATK